jgi:hypothetical protein
MTARPVRIKPTPADIAEMFDTAESHDDFMRASAALSQIPSAMLTDEDRSRLVDAMIRAVSKGKRFPGLTATGGKS